MKHYLLALFVILALLAVPLAALASDITGADYRGTVIVSNNSTATTDVATVFTLNTQDMIDLGYFTSTVNNTALTSVSGTDLIYMPSVNTTYPWSVYIASIGANSFLTNYLYAKDATGGDIRYFPGTAGASVADNATLELGGDGSVSLTNTFINSSASGDLVNKTDAINVATGSGNVTATIYDAATTVTYRPSAAGDETNLTPSSAANYQDNGDNNDGTWVSTTSATYVRDLYNMPDHSSSLSSARIDSVVAYFRTAGDTNGPTFAFKPVFKIGGTVYEGTEQTTTSATITNRTQTYATNPDTGVAWTWSDIDALQYGITEHGDGANAARSYDIWLLVNYTPSASVSQTVAAGEHDYLQVAMASPFFSMVTNANQPASGYVTDGLVLYALPQWQGFDGVDDVIDVSGIVSIADGSPWTIDYWFSPLGTGIQGVVGTNAASNYAGLTNNTLLFWKDAADYRSASVAMTYGTWYNVIITADSSRTITIYLDNVSKGGGVSTNTALAVSSIGDRLIAGGSLPFHGGIGSVRVYNKVLSSTERAQNYALGQPPAQITPEWRNLVMNAPLPQVEEYAAPGGTFTTLDGTASSFTPTGGATWSTAGYVFDGTGYLLHTSASPFNTSQGAIVIWFKTAGDGGLVASADTAGNNNFLNFQVSTGKLLMYAQNPADVRAVSGSTLVNDNTWHMATISSSGTAYTMYVDDGVAETLSVGAGSNDGYWFADVLLRDNISIGALKRVVASNLLTGTAGDTIIYSQPLTSDQRLQIYNALKSRYGVSSDISTYSTLATVADNSNAWTFTESAAATYVEQIAVTVGSVSVAEWEWQYAETWPDSVNSIVMTPSFRTASSDADVSASFTSFAPIEEAKAPAYSLADQVDQISYNNTMSGGFSSSNITATGFPLAGVISAIAIASQTPDQLPLVIIAAVIVLIASLTISGFMKQYGSSGIFPKFFVIVAFMGIFVALNNFGFDFWMIAVFAVEGIAIMFMSKQIGWS